MQNTGSSYPDNLISPLGAGLLGDSNGAATQCLIRPSASAPPVFNAELQDEPAPTSGARDPWIGRVVRENEIEQLVGVGGMGRVYRARHRWLQMPVAVKIMNDGLAADEASIARFHREALAVARLNHRNIVRATDGGAIGSTFFLVTEFVAGENLATLVQRQGRLSVADACEIISQAAEALQHAYENGMVHRDVKPSNLMVTDSGDVKLLDLGLARFTNGYTTLTETGHVMGTLDFMAPEQAGDTRHVDIRADIYSLGCTFYCLLTGMPPFAGPGFDSAISKMAAHAESTPKAAQAFRRDIPKGVLRCLEKMMAKDRSQRFSTPQEIVRALLPFTRGAQLRGLVHSSNKSHNATADSPSVLGQVFSPVAGVFNALITVILFLLRLMLRAIGMIELRATPGSLLRPGETPSARYVFSFKGLINLLLLGFFASLIYMSGFRIHIGAPPPLP